MKKKNQREGDRQRERERERETLAFTFLSHKAKKKIYNFQNFIKMSTDSSYN